MNDPPCEIISTGAQLGPLYFARAYVSAARGLDVCPVEHAGRAPPFGTRKSSRAAHCLFFAHASLRFMRRGMGRGSRRWSTRSVRPRSALAKAAVLCTASFSFAHTLLRLRRRQCGHDPSPGGARKACAPVRHSQKRLAPMALLDLFSYACARASTARGWDVCPVEHAGRAPPFGTRKSSRAAHCLFFICAHSSTPAA